MGLGTILSLIGLVLIITRANIMEPLKAKFVNNPKAVQFLDCPMCVGFYVGALYGAYLAPSITGFIVTQALLCIKLGSIISLLSYVSILVTDCLAKYSEE